MTKSRGLKQLMFAGIFGFFNIVIWSSLIHGKVVRLYETHVLILDSITFHRLFPK
jgi:hypothetical protein